MTNTSSSETLLWLVSDPWIFAAYLLAWTLCGLVMRWAVRGYYSRSAATVMGLLNVALGVAIVADQWLAVGLVVACFVLMIVAAPWLRAEPRVEEPEPEPVEDVLESDLDRRARETAEYIQLLKDRPWMHETTDPEVAKALEWDGESDFKGRNKQ